MQFIHSLTWQVKSLAFRSVSWEQQSDPWIHQVHPSVLSFPFAADKCPAIHHSINIWLDSAINIYTYNIDIMFELWESIDVCVNEKCDSGQINLEQNWKIHETERFKYLVEIEQKFLDS